MFRRHCVLYHYLQFNPRVKWVLVLDADMGVINPNHLIEEYLDNEADIIFANRLFTYEIMAGSFLVQNTEFSQTFIKEWSEFEGKMPSGYNGRDNGALQVSTILYCNYCNRVLDAIPFYFLSKQFNCSPPTL